MIMDDDFFNQAPNVPETAKMSALLIAQTTGFMRTLIAGSINCQPNEIPLDIAYSGAIEALKDYRKYEFQEYLREEIESLKPSS